MVRRRGGAGHGGRAITGLRCRQGLAQGRSPCSAPAVSKADVHAGFRPKERLQARRLSACTGRHPLPSARASFVSSTGSLSLTAGEPRLPRTAIAAEPLPPSAALPRALRQRMRGAHMLTASRQARSGTASRSTAITLDPDNEGVRTLHTLKRAAKAAVGMRLEIDGTHSARLQLKSNPHGGDRRVADSDDKRSPGCA